MLLVERVFSERKVIQGLSNSAAKNYCSPFTASPGPPARGVESRSSPQAPHVGSSAPTQPGISRIPGESFTSHSAPLRVTHSLHCSIGVISCVLTQWLYPCAMCRYCAFKSIHVSHVADNLSIKLCKRDHVVIHHVKCSYTACMYQISQTVP